jgi:hypothetical protein
MQKWTANYLNDPASDYELMVEICCNDKDKAIITQSKNGLEFKIYAHKDDLTIPFDWLLKLINEVQNDLTTNNVFTYMGEIILRCPKKLLQPLCNYLKEEIKIKKQESNNLLRNFIIKLEHKILNQFSISIDIEDFFKTQQDLSLFFLLLHDSVDKVSKKYDWPSQMREVLPEISRKLSNEKSGKKSINN